MKKNLFFYVVITSAFFFYAGCNKSEIEPVKDQKVPQQENLSLTPGQIHFMDSVITKLQAEKPVVSELKAGRIVTVDAVKLDCNTFRLTVNVNQQFCPKLANSSLVAYWTIFDSFGISHPSPTYGTPCIQGTQITLDYTISRTDYLYIVMFLFEPQTGSNNVLLSNTIILKPDC